MDRHSYWLLVWFLIFSVLSTKCISPHLTPHTSVNATDSPKDDSHRLTYVKLGVAVGMFSITAIACALPLIVMLCVARRMHLSTSSTAVASSGPLSLGNASSYASRRINERDASLPTFLLDPQSTESEELLLIRGTDSKTPEASQISNHDASSFCELDSQEDRAVLQNDHSLHWSNRAVANSEGATNGSEGEVLNGVVPPLASYKVIGRRSSQRRARVIRKWASRINCFAAGIFLTTGLMDLFPEVQSAMALALSALNVNSEYPFSALFTLLGFFMVLFVEQSVHICYKRRRRRLPYTHRPDDATAAAPHHHDHQIIPEAEIADETSSTFRIMLLLIALSVHSIFEGLAVGLQRSVSEVVTLFSALLLHKLIMAISMGVSLATAFEQREGRVMRSQWLGALVFALSSPIGVLIGWALIAQRSSPALLMAVAVLQGLACGTFFFVVFCEMLPHEFSESGLMPSVQDRLGKVFSLVFGFAVVATYIVFEPE